MLTLEDLQELCDSYRECLDLKVQEFEIGGRFFPFQSKTHLMGVINLSPDSWYRESVCLTVDQAIQRGKRLVIEGADIVDIGAESSVLSAARVDEKSQVNRLLPVVQELTQAGVLVSVETYEPSVAESCLKAGASVLNLTGTAQTEDIFKIVADFGAAVILCYIEGQNVRSVGTFSLENDMMPRMEEYFSRLIDKATRAGVKKIVLDPGLGFYYTNLQDSAVRVRHQMKTFLHTFRLRKLGWPSCHALPHAFEFFEDEVRIAEPFFAVMALLGKTNLLRTHEVAKVRAVCRTMDSWKS